MNRRQAACAVFAAPALVPAAAGPVDWFNGVRLGARLPDFDAEYWGPVPAADGKLLLIDFWATWCAPCREEFPRLNAIHATFNARGLAVLGLTQEPRSVAEAFVRQSGLQYPVGAAGARPLQKQLGIRALPYAIVADADKTVVWRGQASRLTDVDIERWLSHAAPHRPTASWPNPHRAARMPVRGLPAWARGTVPRLPDAA